MKKTIVAVFGFFLLSQFACGQMYTYVGGESFFPAGADSESADLRMWINVDGAPGKAYVDHSKKIIKLTIRDKSDTLLLNRRYEAEAGDLTWFVEWQDSEHVEVIFYHVAKESGVVRQIFLVAFERKPEGGEFVEAVVPQRVRNDLVAASRQKQEPRERVELVLTVSLDNHPVETVLNRVTAASDTCGLRKSSEPEESSDAVAMYGTEQLLLGVFRENEKELKVALEHYGRHDLATKLQEEMQGLAITQTQRETTMTAEVEEAGRAPLLTAIDAVAQESGLQKRSDSEKVRRCLVSYGDSNLQIEVKQGYSPIELKVVVSSLNNCARAVEVEAALRKVLQTDVE